MTDRQQFVMNRLVAAGYAPVGAAAVVGNGCGESGRNLDSTFDRFHSDHQSGGFLEWRDSAGAPRKTRLAAFARAHQMSLDDLGIQVDYAVWELGKYFQSLDFQLRNPEQRSIENLTLNFCNVYENPAPATAGYDRRIAYAKEAFAEWKASREIPLPRPAPIPEDVPSIPAPDAGRQTSVLDQLHQISEKYAAEIAQLPIVREKAAIDEAILKFGGTPPLVQIDQHQPRGPTMNSSKAAIASTGVWGSVIALLIPIASQIADSMGTSVDPKLQAIGMTLAALLALYGRITATTKITGVLKS